MKHKSVVIVFDNGGAISKNIGNEGKATRCSAMASSFHACADIVIAAGWDADKGEVTLDQDHHHAVLPVCDLLLMHLGDDDRLEAILKLTKPCKIVYYSGVGGSDMRARHRKIHMVQRKIYFIEQALKESEAEELLEFAANPNPVIPHLLIPERVKEMSIAMAILCQGFLTVFAKDRSDFKEFPPVVKDALQKIGWKSDSDLSEVHEQFSVVSKPVWWNRALGLRDVQHQHSNLASTNLKEAFSLEWDTSRLPDDLSLLCKTLEKADEDVSAELVAQCYLTIAMSLEK